MSFEDGAECVPNPSSPPTYAFEMLALLLPDIHDSMVRRHASAVKGQNGSTVPGMRRLSEALLRQHHVFVASDNAFQQRARLLQALWREGQGLPIGAKSNGEPLGSRIPLEMAKETLANFLTDTIRESVRRELAAVRGGSHQLIAEERLYANLLSSQPLTTTASRPHPTRAEIGPAPCQQQLAGTRSRRWNAPLRRTAHTHLASTPLE
jgi:PD-(D/E)XK nuclease superfamily